MTTLRRFAPALACASVLLPLAGVAACNGWSSHVAHMEDLIQAAAIGAVFCAAAAIVGILALIGSTRVWQRVVAVVGIVTGVALILRVLVL